MSRYIFGWLNWYHMCISKKQELTCPTSMLCWVIVSICDEDLHRKRKIRLCWILRLETSLSLWIMMFAYSSFCFWVIDQSTFLSIWLHSRTTLNKTKPHMFSGTLLTKQYKKDIRAFPWIRENLVTFIIFWENIIMFYNAFIIFLFLLICMQSCMNTIFLFFIYLLFILNVY